MSDNKTGLEKIESFTPNSLLEDNQSKRSQEGLVVWNEMEKRGLLITVWGCSDARFIVPDPYRVNVIRSIAASGSSQPFETLLSDKSSTAILLIIHHDGDSYRRGHTLKGCGGLAARSEINLERKVDDEGIEHYIGTHVNHPDPLVQAGIRASAISHRATKPVLAATQDHLSGKITPFALYRWNGLSTDIKTSVLPHYSFQNVYDASKIYENGIPYLDGQVLARHAPEFIQLLDEHTRNLKQLHQSIPDLALRQKVQRPHSVVIKTSRRPKELTYPKSFGFPGSGFTIVVPRYDELSHGQRVTFLHEDDISNVLDQAEYPISHAVENYDQVNKPFSTVKRIYIETPDLKASTHLAEELTKRHWTQEWLAKSSDNKIIVGQEYKGVLEEADWYKPS